MSRSRDFAVVTLSLLSVVGCAGPTLMRFDAEPTQGQSVTYIRGTAVVVADGGAVRVLFGCADPAPEKDQRINFYIGIRNLGDVPITVSDEHIKAVRSDGQEIRVWRAIDVRQDIAQRADRQRFAATLAGSLGAFGAGYTGDEAASRENRQRMQLQIAQADNQESFENALTGLFLDRETLAPGQSYIGYVQIDPPDRKGLPTEFKFLTLFGSDPIPLSFRYYPAH